MLLELSRLLSKLYRSRSTHPRLNLVLLLTAGGKLNYAGTRHWLDENGDSLETAGSQGVQFVLCLDSLAQGDTLSLHVSKPPKQGSSGERFYDVSMAGVGLGSDLQQRAFLDRFTLSCLSRERDAMSSWYHLVLLIFEYFYRSW